MKKLLLLLFVLFSSSIIFSQTLNQPSQSNNVCDVNNDGYATFFMQEIANEIVGNNQNLVVTHHETQTDANFGINPLPATYFNIVPNSQTIYARVVNTVTSQVQVISYALNVHPSPVAFPHSMTACDVNNNGFGVFDINSTIGIFLQGSVANTVTFHETQTDALSGMNPLSSPYLNIIANMQVLWVRITNVGTGCFAITQLNISIVICQGQAGQPQDLTICADSSTLGCFNLTLNTPNILGTLNQAEYTVTYHASQNDANAGVNPLSSPYCPAFSPSTVFARLTKNSDSTFQVMPFSLITITHQNATTQLTPISQCDDNNNGAIIWDLTVVQAQLNTNNGISYYTNFGNATLMINPIANPVAFSTGVQSMSIFIREIILGGCDLIYPLQLYAASNCNIAFTCSSANSLCNSLGVPFSNTINLSSGSSPGCLGSTPNPTWFYLPISGAGNLNFQINQGNNAPNYNNLDVDFVCWGPFSGPQCTGLYDYPDGNIAIPNNIVACSYSASPVENFVIGNALPGQYYILMVTNFSNQLGQIRISQTNLGAIGSGTIDCTGLELNAFLDGNNNGTKDSGESNFSLGQFHYEKNNDGVVHHITAPTGNYNIYDTNNANSYDVNYTVDASYAAMYNVTPSSYSNLSVAVGMVTYYFPVTVVQNYNDLAVTIVPLTAPRPGFTYQEKLLYTNFGNQNMPSGTLTFTKDANVTITANTQTGTTPTANGFTYNFTNLAPFESRNITVTMQVPTIPTVAMGQVLTNAASIVPLTGDLVLENNASSSSQIIINAYDPNDKMESHGGRILHSTFTSNDYLYYTIRFENLGTASAINVRVNDVLNSQLDEATIRMISASHAYELDRVGNNLTWRFNNIQLPVSVANSTIGKGYITFKIKPITGFAIGDIIPNTASIYFDFNPAIVTNTFNTQFVAALGIDQFENENFVFYPNPTSDIVTVSLTNAETKIASIIVYDVLGKTILSSKAANINTQTIDLSHVNSGIYFIEVTTDSNLKVVKKLMVN